MFSRWAGMIQRCTNKNNVNYHNYGGRGITVCDRWRDSAMGERNGFDNFVDDMGECPTGLTLERVDNNAGYSPENCKWATWEEQAANKRQNGGFPIKSTSLRQRSIAAGVPYHVVYMRVTRFGWTTPALLSTPKQPRGRQIGWRKPKAELPPVAEPTEPPHPTPPTVYLWGKL